MYVRLENEKVASAPRTSSLSVEGELTFDLSTLMLTLYSLLLLPLFFSCFPPTPSSSFLSSPFPYSLFLLPSSFLSPHFSSCSLLRFYPKDMRSLCCPRPTDTYHTIVIDCAAIGFVDSMGTSVLEQVATLLFNKSVVALARIHGEFV